MEDRDFEEIADTAELDAAKMVMRLAAELRDKDAELAALRLKAMEEVQRHRKAKDAEVEAVASAQEERMSGRERELAEMWVKKEAELWQKYQMLLDAALSKNREELEEERKRFQEELRKREAELPTQRNLLRREMEDAFKRWEAEREEQLKYERETFVRELELGREVAHKEARERIVQVEEIWKQKLAQQERELNARYQSDIQTSRRKIREEAFKEVGRMEEEYASKSLAMDGEIKALRENLQADFDRKEEELHSRYQDWMEENRRGMETETERRQKKVEADYKAQLSRVSGSVARLESELSSRETEWRQKYDELQAHFHNKELNLERMRKDMTGENLANENGLAQKYQQMESELRVALARQREELDRREQQLREEASRRENELSRAAETRQAELEEQAARLSREQQELGRRQSELSNLFRQREQELAKAYDDRLKSFQLSIEESFKVREQTIAARCQQMEKQQETILHQKESAFEQLKRLKDENASLKNQLEMKENAVAEKISQEQQKSREHREKFELAVHRRQEKLEAQYIEKEQQLARAYSEKLEMERARLEAQSKIREKAISEREQKLQQEALAGQTRLLEELNAKEAEMELRYQEGVRNLAKELEESRGRHEAETARLRAGLEEEKKNLKEEVSALERRLKEENEAALKKAEESHRAEIARIGEEAVSRHESGLARALGESEEQHKRKILELENTNRLLEQQCQSLVRAQVSAAEDEKITKEQLQSLYLQIQQMESEKQRFQTVLERKCREAGKQAEEEYRRRAEKAESDYSVWRAKFAEDAHERERTREAGHLQKLEMLRQELSSKYRNQAEELERIYMEKESSALKAMEENYALIEKTLEARYQQMEKSYQAVLINRTMAVEQDKRLAGDITKLKEELESKAAELTSKLQSEDKRNREIRDKLEREYEKRKAELEESNRIRAVQVENERAKLSAWMLQEEKLLSELQKRELVLRETASRKEAELEDKFEKNRARLEKEYAVKLKEVEELKEKLRKEEQ